MGKVAGRTNRDIDEMKRLTMEFLQSGKSDQTILEHLNELDLIGEKPVTLRTLKRWKSEIPEVHKDDVIEAVYFDMIFLRQQAYKYTAMAEINRAYLTERAYWWGLYISSLHIVLRQALAIEAAGELPPQFIMDNLEKFYADIRKVQQMTPPLDLGGAETKAEETVEELNARMKRFEERYGRNIKLPKETL